MRSAGDNGSLERKLLGEKDNVIPTEVRRFVLEAVMRNVFELDIVCTIQLN